MCDDPRNWVDANDSVQKRTREIWEILKPHTNKPFVRRVLEEEEGSYRMDDVIFIETNVSGLELDKIIFEELIHLHYRCRGLHLGFSKKGVGMHF